jgi:RecA-family ATPase
VALGGLCVRHGCAVLLLAHPSASAMSSGDGGGFSTAWNNSVRSRLYLRRPKTDDAEAAKDRRILEVRKANYAADGTTIPLIYSRGCFVPDDRPVQEGSGVEQRTVKRSSTRLATAILGLFLKHAPSGEIMSFKALLDPLQATGDIKGETYEVVRKPLQRALKDLVNEGVLIESKVPRGYRLAPKSPEVTP